MAAASAARADIGGQYTGYGEGAGTTIDLVQTGTALNGVIGGDVDGVLLGTATGDTATGVVLLFDVAKFPFTAVFTGSELRITITGVNGQQTLIPFTLDGAAAPTTLPTAPTKPAPQPPQAPPVLDHAAVTEALRALLTGLVAIEFDDQPPAAQAGFVECLIGVTAPLSAEELQMLVDTGFNPDDAMIVRFDRTVPGIDAAVAACFTAADVPAETPPPVPTKPGPAPATAPAPDPAATPPPVALDDAVVDGNLRTVLVGVVAAELPDATDEQRTAVVACLMAAVAPLPAADRQHLADIGFEPDDREAARLEALVPGISMAVQDCLLAYEPVRTSVTLSNGATVTVEGGVNHMFEAIDGGYRIAVDATDIVVTATELVVAGATTPLPASFPELVVAITDTGFAITVDGAPLPAN